MYKLKVHDWLGGYLKCELPTLEEARETGKEQIERYDYKQVIITHPDGKEETIDAVNGPLYALGIEPAYEDKFDEVAGILTSKAKAELHRFANRIEFEK